MNIYTYICGYMAVHNNAGLYVAFTEDVNVLVPSGMENAIL